MGGAPVVIALVGLVIPITLLLAALVFDVVVMVWALFRWWNDSLSPRVVGVLRVVAGRYRRAQPLASVPY